MLARSPFRRLEAAYETALRRAGAAGQLADGVDPVARARLLVAVMHGIRVMGTSGAPESALQQIVDGALRGVRA